MGNQTKQDSKEYIGKKLKLARTMSKLTQENLAEKLDVSPEHVSKMERGISYGSLETFINICKTLNVHPDFLLHGVIDNTSTDLSDFIDEDFLANYLKLNSSNKDLLSIFTNDLVKFQEKNRKSKIVK